MLTESVAHGAADSEQTRGMITSLWFISENLGAYAGASLGGFVYDKIGFEHGTTVVIGTQVSFFSEHLKTWGQTSLLIQISKAMMFTFIFPAFSFGGNSIDVEVK